MTVVQRRCGAQASARLLPEVLALLQRAGCTLQQVDAIGFGRGPGAFTGLRSACSVAQGLALGAGKPVLALDSLLLVAQDALDELGDQPPIAGWRWTHAWTRSTRRTTDARASVGTWPMRRCCADPTNSMRAHHLESHFYFREVFLILFQAK